MEWITLFLLAPLLLVPVVFLWGYAGCGFSIRLPGPIAPMNLVVTAVTGRSVSLAWSHEAAVDEVVSFEIERRKEGDPPVAPPFTSTEATFTDVNLDPSTLYHYRVRAVSGVYTSDYTPEVDATTLPPTPCFSAALAANRAGLEGFCIVQRIAPSRLAASGTLTFITLRGSTVANLLIDRVFISQPAAAGDVYDSAADLTSVASAVTVPANTPVTLRVEYALDETRPLLVIFDITTTAGLGNVRIQNPVPTTEAVIFSRPATAEAAIADRLPSASNPGASPYTLSDSVYLIETIEVA